MHATVVVFPGSNADAEMIHTLRDVCGAPTTVVWHTDTALHARGRISSRDRPGGFAFGDYLRVGAIAKVSPIVVPRPSSRTPSGGGTSSASATAFRS